LSAIDDELSIMKSRSILSMRLLGRTFTDCREVTGCWGARGRSRQPDAAAVTPADRPRASRVERASEVLE
jgi:hypothetical protein